MPVSLKKIDQKRVYKAIYRHYTTYVDAVSLANAARKAKLRNKHVIGYKPTVILVY